MRFAAAWTGDGFIDWKGIHFNGQHQVHPKLAGERARREPGRARLGRPGDRELQRPAPARPRQATRTARSRGSGHSSRAPTLRRPDDRSRTPSATRRFWKLAGAETDAREGHRRSRARWKLGKSSRDLLARIAPDRRGRRRHRRQPGVTGRSGTGSTSCAIPAAATPTRVKVLMAKGDADDLAAFAKTSPAPRPLEAAHRGRAEALAGGAEDDRRRSARTTARSRSTRSALPERNPWNAQLRLTGFDFLPDGKRMAVCSWDGDVWLVGGHRQARRPG